MSSEQFIGAAWNSCENFLDFDSNMKSLKRQVALLSSQAEDTETRLMNLEQEGKKKRKLEVKVWLEQVEEMKMEFDTFNESITNGGIMEKVKSLKYVKTMTGAVKEIRDEGKNIGELTVDVDESTIPSLAVSQLSGKTSNDNLEKLYGWLEDDKISSIGVYGQRGVGKTTLVKHIHNRILQKMPHVKVYWVTVSNDYSIKKLQDDIAKIARLQFLDENEEHRAAILHQHLAGKKTVLMLDDVRMCIPLEKLGIPHRNEGCKFIITSRSLQVCRLIQCQELFEVKTLNENEAWDLFKEKLSLCGHTVLNDVIEKHAKELANRCNGVPLALNIAAARMRGVDNVHRWRSAVIQMSTLDQIYRPTFININRPHALNSKEEGSSSFCLKLFEDFRPSLFPFVSKRCMDSLAISVLSQKETMIASNAPLATVDLLTPAAFSPPLQPSRRSEVSSVAPTRDSHHQMVRKTQPDEEEKTPTGIKAPSSTSSAGSRRGRSRTRRRRRIRTVKDPD
nr:probable disease resistance protein At4g27220 [Ipomoea batatas]